MILPIVGLLTDVGERARLFGATLVLLVLTSVLPPILRRMQLARKKPVRLTNGSHEFLAGAVIQIADRIDASTAIRATGPLRYAPRPTASEKLAQSFEN